MKNEIVHELLLQALETERGGIQIYAAALDSAQNDDLREEWEKYHAQTQQHEQILLGVFKDLGLDPDEETPGRAVVRHLGESLVAAIRRAADEASLEAAQLVACECVVLAETKDHLNWELIEEIAKHSRGKQRESLENAFEEIEDEEDKHLYHTEGWTRELWLETLGLPAVLPPPEEQKDVETAIGAARAKQQREDLL